MKRAIYYDTETTGLNPKENLIIELAAYDATNDTSFSTLINPNTPIPQEVTNITNITDDMVKDAPLFKEVATKFLEFIGDDSILIAHNNDRFDRPFLEHEYARNDIPFPKINMIDSLKWAKKYRSDLPKHNLQYLREVYGITANQAHRALDDVKVLHALFTQMTDDLSVEQIYTLLYETKEKTLKMPFGKHRGKPLTAVPKGYLSWLSSSGALEKSENEDLKTSLTELGLINA